MHSLKMKPSAEGPRKLAAEEPKTSQEMESKKDAHYSEFETLYESVLFKKPELITSKVFVNAMNELKTMKDKIEVPGLEKDLHRIDDLLTRLYSRVQATFPKLNKEPLAKLLINIKDRLQSKKPHESVGKIRTIIIEYLSQIKDVGMEKETGAKHDGRGRRIVRERKAPSS